MPTLCASSLTSSLPHRRETVAWFCFTFVYLYMCMCLVLHARGSVYVSMQMYGNVTVAGARVGPARQECLSDIEPHDT